MASRRFRSRRALANNVDFMNKRLSYLEKHPAPKRLQPHVVTTQKVQQKSITAPKLADNSVTSNAIADNAVTTNAIADAAITANLIADGAITVDKVGFTASDIGASTSYTSDEPPLNPTIGDLWFDTNNNNLLSQWNGTSWVSVRDLTISAAANTANAANAAAANAVIAANAATVTANSKNKIIRSTSAATGTTGYSAGDLWWQMESTSATANVIGQWTFDGTKWNVNTLRNEVIATLDAAKITTGFLAANRLQANSIDASVIAAGTITGSRIAANTINASSIVTGSITATQIAASTITGDLLTATAINGKVITGAVFQTSAITSGVNRVVIDSAQSNRISFYAANGIAPGYIEAINADASTGAQGAGLYIYTPQYSGSTGLTGRPYIQMINATTGYESYMRLVADLVTIGPINYGIYPVTLSVGGRILVNGGGDTTAVSTTTIHSRYISTGSYDQLVQTSPGVATYVTVQGPIYAGSDTSSRNGIRNITLSLNAASGGIDGDVWLQYV